jgi:hypothetical protein
MIKPSFGRCPCCKNNIFFTRKFLLNNRKCSACGVFLVKNPQKIYVDIFLVLAFFYLIIWKQDSLGKVLGILDDRWIEVCGILVFLMTYLLNSYIWGYVKDIDKNR